jgi:RND superfamily putative drug exporter
VNVSTESLARAASRRPWWTLAAWLAAVGVSVGVIALLIGGALTSEGDVTAQTESKRATELLDERLPPTSEAVENEVTEVVVVRLPGRSVADSAFRQRVEALSTELRAAGAANVTTFYESGDERLVSTGRDATLLLVALGPDPEKAVEAVVDAVEAADRQPGLAASITGEWTLDADFGQLSQDDLKEGELFFGAPAALVVLLLVFGAVVAGLIPLLLAVVSIVVALALTALLGQVFELSLFVQNMLTGMGLALGIDYALFILSRYREERADGRQKPDAIAVAGATASRAVLFSGIAFVLAMFGMVLVPDTIMRSLAVGAILVGIVSVLAALTLLPAVLGLLGDRVNALRIPVVGRSAARAAGCEGRCWGGVVRAVMRRPLASLLAAVALLFVAALPVLDLETGSAGISTLPDRFASKQGFLALNAEFPGETTDPAVVVIDGEVGSPPVARAIARLRARLEHEQPLGRPTVETHAAKNLAILTVPVAGDPQGERAITAVERLRSTAIPQAFAGVEAEALVGGTTAEVIDYVALTSDWLPRIFAFVLGLSFVLLTIAFRSLVVPLTAIVMNLLSVGAAYGLLVLVFQKGVGNELFGFTQVDTVEAWVPLFLFSVLFGLSMDYQVFLLSRIRERFNRTGDNSDAVFHGVGSTARIITGAALIIVAVFSGFARGDLVMFQQMGFGVAVALLIDATIIRSVVVPASMELLGRRTWYLPAWLTWLPQMRVEGSEEDAVAAAARRTPDLGLGSAGSRGAR